MLLTPRQLACLTSLLLSGMPALVAAQPVEALSEAESAEVAALVDQGETQDLLRQLALQAIPRVYENTKQWGQTKRVWDGLHISTDRLQIKTKRRWREANHGTWKRYQAWLIDPEQHFNVRIESIRPLEPGRIAFDVVVDARLGLFARLSEWQLGVQLVSVSTDAEATVQLRLGCATSMRVEFPQLLPELVIDPEVQSAQLKLVDLDLQRISDLRGPAVEQLGRSLRDVLQDEINDRQPRLVAQANRQIDKNRHKLRLSMQGLAEDGWEKARRWLPSP